VSTERSGKSARTRRTGQEVRSRLITAARDVFAERGYAGASTREIAKQAEVTEVLLFRHFGSKAGLFDEAVLDTFVGFVDEWANRWARRGLRGESMEELGRDYIELLYEFLEENRQLVVALLAARAHHPTTAARLDELFVSLEKTVREGTVEQGLPSRDPAITVRLTFGMVLSAVIHADILFPSGPRLTRTRIVDELTRYMFHGIAHLP
jgi:AcrR family transcriptional regulator